MNTQLGRQPVPTEAEYRDKVGTLDHTGLVGLWEEIEAGNTPGWEPGKAFEYSVLRAFELEGARVTWPYRVELAGQVVEQIDGVIYAADLVCLVESKQHSQPINIETIAKLRNQLARRPVSAIGLVFSYAGFTEPARLLTRYLAPQTILLWTREEIEHALRGQQMVLGLALKFKYAVEHCVPDYNLLEAQ
jgi:hypothetical protein